VGGGARVGVGGCAQDGDRAEHRLSLLASLLPVPPIQDGDLLSDGVAFDVSSRPT